MAVVKVYFWAEVAGGMRALWKSGSLSLSSLPSAHRLPQTVLPHWLSQKTTKNSNSKKSRSKTCPGQTCYPSLGACALQLGCVQSSCASTNAVCFSQWVILEIFSQISARPISNESTKETKKPLAGSKDPSEDQGSHPSEVQAASISSTQLVYVVSDLDRLQEWVSFPALGDI